MRRIDKKLNLAKANLLSEQRYLASKGVVKEDVQLDGTPEFSDLIIVRTDTEFILVNKQDNTIEAQLGPIGAFKSKEHLCDSALRFHGELFEKLNNVYHGGGDIIGPLSACQKGGLEENEMGGEQPEDKEVHDAAVTGFKELKNNVGDFSKSIDNISPEEVEKLKSFLSQKTGKPFESIKFSDLESLAKSETETLEEGFMDVIKGIGAGLSALGIGSSLVGSIYSLYNTVGLPIINHWFENQHVYGNDASGKAYLATLLFYATTALLCGQILYRTSYDDPYSEEEKKRFKDY